jgi:hypothetical protein
LKKIGMSESCVVHYNITKLTVLFVFVGSMMVVVPMLIGQVHARTVGIAESSPLSSSDTDTHFTKVKWHLDAGRWIETPRVSDNGHVIEWVTAGPLPFGGNERGAITANLEPYRQVTFFFNNPVSGRNTCDVQYDKAGSKVYFSDPPCKMTSQKINPRLSPIAPAVHACYVVSIFPQFSGVPFDFLPHNFCSPNR